MELSSIRLSRARKFSGWACWVLGPGPLWLRYGPLRQLLLASPLTLPILSRHACSARFSSLSWFSASSWWTTNTSSLTGARGRAWVDVPAPPNTSCGLLSTGSSDWEQTLWLGKARRPFCPTVANGWWHHCTLGLGCLWAQNFPMDDAHSEGVHNRLGPDISWRPATT